MHIPLAKQIRPPFRIRKGCVYLEGHTIPVTVEHRPDGVTVTYRSPVADESMLGPYFHYMSRCLNNRKDSEDVLKRLIAKGMVRL